MRKPLVPRELPLVFEDLGPVVCVLESATVVRVFESAAVVRVLEPARDEGGMGAFARVLESPRDGGAVRVRLSSSVSLASVSSLELADIISSNNLVSSMVAVSS